LCAGGTLTEESACPGDSGGGLQAQDDLGRWTLVGIVSNGPSICGLQPVVFHKIENSIDWIVKSMQLKYSTP
jgi:secreted trypsin-like serine protease